MLKKLGFNVFYIIFALFSVWTALSGLVYAGGKTANNILISAAFIALITAAGVIFYKMPQISEKSYKTAVPILFILFYILLTAFGTTTMTVPISDLEVLVKAADSLLENSNLIDYSYYFTICRNTLGNCLFIALMFLPLYKMGINIFTDKAEMWGIAVNCFMIVLTVFFMWKLAKRVLKNRNMEIFFILLCSSYIPYYLWAHRYYSDTLSLMFLPLSVLLYDNSRNAEGYKKPLWSAACGISIWAGYFLRGSIAVVLVAIIIFSAFCDRKDFFKTGFVAALTFAAALNCWDFYVHNNNWIDFSNDAIDCYPAAMWLMYGAHGEGNYCEEDVTYMSSLPDYQSRKEAAAGKLAEYYSRYNSKSYVKFLTLKYGKTWGNGRFDAENYLNNQRRGNFTHKFLIDGMPYTALFTYIANGLHFAALFLNIIGIWLNFKNKQWNIPMLLQIIFLGNILFLSFWETKARYALGATPVILFITVFAVKTICDKILGAVEAPQQIKEEIKI